MTYSRKSNGWVLKTRRQGIIMIIASHLSNQRGPTRLQAWTDYRGWRTERLYHQDCFLLHKKCPWENFEESTDHHLPCSLRIFPQTSFPSQLTITHSPVFIFSWWPSQTLAVGAIPTWLPSTKKKHAYFAHDLADLQSKMCPRRKL